MPETMGHESLSTDVSGARIHRMGLGLATWVADHEILWLVLTVPLLIFPGRWNLVGIVFWSIAWLCRWAARGHLAVRTPVDWAIGLLAAMVPVTLWATALPGPTQVAVLQLLAGIGLCYTLANWASTPQRIWQSGLGLVGLGAALAALAPVSVAWKTGKLFSLPQVYGRLPLLLRDPVHPNVMGGALSLIMPMALALAWAVPGGGTQAGDGRRRVYRPAMAIAWLLMAVVLLLTKSRGAYMGTFVASLVVAALHSRWFALGLPGSVIGLVVASQRFGLRQVVDALTTGADIGTWSVRLEVWSRAAYMMQDFPFTGIGMGSFGQVAQAMYPFFMIGPEVDVPHAHNLFLQVGVDLGVPGLVAYLALLLLCFWMACQIYGRSEDGEMSKPLAVGLLGSLAALVVHGLTDAVAWAAKPAIIPWAIFGLTTAVYLLSENKSEVAPCQTSPDRHTGQSATSLGGCQQSGGATESALLHGMIGCSSTEGATSW